MAVRQGPQCGNLCFSQISFWIVPFIAVPLTVDIVRDPVVDLGRTTTLQCLVIGYPTPSITWIRQSDNSIITTNSKWVPSTHTLCWNFNLKIPLSTRTFQSEYYNRIKLQKKIVVESDLFLIPPIWLINLWKDTRYCVNLSSVPLALTNAKKRQQANSENCGLPPGNRFDLEKGQGHGMVPMKRACDKYHACQISMLCH